MLLLTAFTLAMSVIRMIKLFGWEPRVAAQLSDKREEELELVKKNKLLDLVNNNLKCVSGVSPCLGIGADRHAAMSSL